MWDPEPFSPCKFQNKSGLKKRPFALDKKKKKGRKSLLKRGEERKWGKEGESAMGGDSGIRDDLKSNIPITLEAKYWSVFSSLLMHFIEELGLHSYQFSGEENRYLILNQLQTYREQSPRKAWGHWLPKRKDSGWPPTWGLTLAKPGLMRPQKDFPLLQ